MSKKYVVGLPDTQGGMCWSFLLRLESRGVESKHGTVVVRMWLRKWRKHYAQVNAASE